MNDLKALVDDLHIQAEHAKMSDDIPNRYAENAGTTCKPISTTY